MLPDCIRLGGLTFLSWHPHATELDMLRIGSVVLVEQPPRMPDFEGKGTNKN